MMLQSIYLKTFILYLRRIFVHVRDPAVFHERGLPDPASDRSRILRQKGRDAERADDRPDQPFQFPVRLFLPDVREHIRRGSEGRTAGHDDRAGAGDHCAADSGRMGGSLFSDKRAKPQRRPDPGLLPVELRDHRHDDGAGARRGRRGRAGRDLPAPRDPVLQFRQRAGYEYLLGFREQAHCGKRHEEHGAEPADPGNPDRAGRYCDPFLPACRCGRTAGLYDRPGPPVAPVYDDPPFPHGIAARTDLPRSEPEDQRGEPLYEGTGRRNHPASGLGAGHRLYDHIFCGPGRDHHYHSSDRRDAHLRAGIAACHCRSHHGQRDGCRRRTCRAARGLDERPEYGIIVHYCQSHARDWVAVGSLVPLEFLFRVFWWGLSLPGHRGLTPLPNEKYPEGDTIQVILDNHTVHTSKKVKQYLETIPGRFIFIFTPKHGSWLNMIEGFFGKMTRQMLRGIRVATKQELIDRIYKYFDEVNETPVVYHWKYKMEDFGTSIGVAN